MPSPWKRFTSLPSPWLNCGQAWRYCRRASADPGLHESLEKRVLPLFAGRVLPFDLPCTQAYAALIAKARSAGLAIATADAYIAAIAAANGFTVATRDTRPFEAAGVAVINPWVA